MKFHTIATIILVGACSLEDTPDTPDIAPEMDAETGESPGASEAAASGCRRDPMLPGDTRPCTVMKYPADAFWKQNGGGGRVIDVTRPPFNAKGDGVTDDTGALVAAYDYVMNEVAKGGWNKFFPASNQPSFIIYLPDGTYRVRDTIVYSGPERRHHVGNTESLVWIRIIGQSREHTKIRLDGNLPAFAANQPPRPVISFGKSNFNNIPASNSLRNLSVLVGPGNPNAIGVKFGGANQSDITNVLIRSQDSEHRGAVGLDNAIGTVLSYQRDLVVDGFDVGIRMAPYHFTMPALEHVSIRNQRVAGVELIDGIATLRRLHSNNKVPAVLLSGSGSHAVVTDSALVGGEATQPAVKIVKGHFFGRGLRVDGYLAGVMKSGAVVVPGTVDEYVSDPMVPFSSTTPTRSLGLGVVEVPSVAWAPLNQWVRPNTPGDGVADASPAIRDAMKSDKSTIYLPGHEYRMASTVDIPCSVKRINGMFSLISGTAGIKFRVLACSAPLLVHDLEAVGGVAFEHVGMRPLILDRVVSRSHIYRNSVTDGRPTLFGNMIDGLKDANPLHDMRAFLRVIDGESISNTQWLIDSATVWVFGFKSEKTTTAFRIKNKGKLEVLGGIFNQYTQQPIEAWQGSVAVVNDKSTVSIVAATNGPCPPPIGQCSPEGFEVLVRDIQTGATRDLAWDSPLVPPRVGRPHNVIIPLYRSP